MKRRVFALLMALVLALSSFPLGAYAAEDGTGSDDPTSSSETTAPTTESDTSKETTAPTTEPDASEETTAPTTEPDASEETTAPTTEPDASEETTAPTTEPDASEETTAPTTEPDASEETTAPTTEPDGSEETTAPTTEPETEPTEETTASIDLLNERSLTQAQIEEQLVSTGYLHLTQEFILESDFTIPEGTSLILSYMTIPKHCTLTVNGHLTIQPNEDSGTGQLLADKHSNVVIGSTGSIGVQWSSKMGDFCTVEGIDSTLIFATYVLSEGDLLSEKITQDWLTAAARKYKSLHLSIEGTLAQSLIIPPNVHIFATNLTIPEDGILENHGYIYITEGLLTNNGTIDNYGNISMDTRKQFVNNGRLLGLAIFFGDDPLPGETLTQAQIEEQLASVPHLQLTQDFVLESDFTIPEGKSLTVSYMTIPAGLKLTVEGSLYVEPSETTGTGKLLAEDGSTVTIGEKGSISTSGNSDLGDFCPVIGIDLAQVSAGYDILDNVKFSDVVTQSWIDSTLKKYKHLALGTSGPQVITQSLTFPENVNLVARGLTIADGCTLTNYGRIAMQSNYLTINGTLDNRGVVYLLIDDQLKNNGTLLGNPLTFKDIPQISQDQLEEEIATIGFTATNKHVTLVRDFHIPPRGSIDITVGGRVTIPAGITMKVDGKARLSSFSSIIIEKGGTLDINHSVLVASNSKIVNDGTLILNEKGSVLTIRADSELTGTGKVQEIGGVKLDYSTLGANPKSDLDKLATSSDKLLKEDILNAVQGMGVDKLAQIMQSPKNNAAMDDLLTLENAVGGPAKVVVQDTGDLAIDPAQVTVVGTRLNQTIFSMEPKLIFGPPEGTDNQIPTGCDESLAIHFSMNLENVVNPENLLVPVCISFPIPKTMTAENLAIIHYHHDGSHEIIHLNKKNTYTENGQRFASIVLTSFSDFALVPLLYTPAPEVDLDAISQPIRDLTTENVTSAHRPAIGQVLKDTEDALALENLTAEQKKSLEDLKARANALLAALDAAHAAVDTKDIQAALDISAQDLTLSDEQALDDAYAILSKAAASSNFTKDEREALQKKADSIQEKRTMIANAKAAIVLLDKLPDKVTPDNLQDREAVCTARRTYTALNAHEQRLVGQELANKLARLEKALEYRIIQGDNSIWKRSSAKGLTITANGPTERFKGIQVDGAAVNEAYYTVSSGSTVVVLAPQFLNDLKLGRHTISFHYENDLGGTEDLTATGTFRISSVFSFNPKTGDTIYITIAILILSALALAAMFLWMYRRNRRK